MHGGDPRWGHDSPGGPKKSSLMPQASVLRCSGLLDLSCVLCLGTALLSGLGVPHMYSETVGQLIYERLLALR